MIQSLTYHGAGINIPLILLGETRVKAQAGALATLIGGALLVNFFDSNVHSQRMQLLRIVNIFDHQECGPASFVYRLICRINRRKTNRR